MCSQDFAPPSDPETGTKDEPKSFIRGKQSPIVRFGKRLRDPVNAWFAKQSLIGDPPVVDADRIEGLEPLRLHWRHIQAELLALMADREDIPAFGKISPDHRRIASNDRWKSYFFEGYGYRSSSHRQQCPRTAELLDGVPGLVVAFFSIMEPDTYVPRHRGLTKAWLNCHLGLAIPSGPDRCEIEIGDQRNGWAEGEWLVFDETNPHEVWNETDESRVVLFLQVQRPMTWKGKMAARAIHAIIRRTSFVKDASKAIDA